LRSLFSKLSVESERGESRNSWLVRIIEEMFMSIKNILAILHWLADGIKNIELKILIYLIMRESISTTSSVQSSCQVIS
jgi:hypothetical protein